MTIDWMHFTPWTSLAGGALIGLAAGLFVVLNGRVAGISGVLGGLFSRSREGFGERLLFVSGLLVAVTVLPYAIRMSGLFYLACALVLGAIFVGYAWRLLTAYSDALARKTFRFSIVHLSLLFAALLVDHYLGLIL